MLHFGEITIATGAAMICDQIGHFSSFETKTQGFFLFPTLKNSPSLNGIKFGMKIYTHLFI